MQKIEWGYEKLDENNSRAKVIGGWIVTCMYANSKVGACMSSVFIHDSGHQWNIAKPKEPEAPKPRIDPKDFEAPKAV